MATAPRLRQAAPYALLAAVALLALPFVLHALSFGWRGFRSDLSGETYLFAREAPRANAAIFGHMLAGAMVTLLAPLQLVAPLRRRWPRVHRWSGWIVVALSLPSALGGLAYIGLRGTIGGPLMDAAFAGYGLCLLVAAAQTARFGRTRNLVRHREWGLRLFVLAIGSWLYRLHYALWHLASGGLGSEADFSGPFDRVTLFAFYVPYLVALELWFRRERRRAPLTASAPR